MSRRAVRSALVGAATARIAYGALRARPPSGAKTWSRVNHRGEPVTLLAGPALAIGGIAAAAVAPASPRNRLAAALACGGAAAFGSYDDLAGDRSATGFRGHLAALARGEVTSGTVKLAGIGATAVAAALIADTPDGSRPASAADRLLRAGLVAGGANLINLFDLRPGRAIKVAMLAGGLLAAAPGGAAAVTPALASAVALLPEDLGEHAMLGDAGANALGALLGIAAGTTLPRRGQVLALAGIVALTGASEFVSFTQVIEHTGPLRWLDLLGRRPGPAGQAEPAGQPQPAADGRVGDPGPDSRPPGARRLARTR
jgi:UDP-GlcNAc:undecaprenyl-phosphate/decaprenyl-phosphate GlcNAc-1-phosphate transferase